MSIVVILSIAMAHTWLRFEDPQKTYVACALMLGAIGIVLAGRYVINGFFSWRTNRTTQKLENAISQKTTLLDLVKETLKFKVTYLDQNIKSLNLSQLYSGSQGDIGPI